MVRQQRRCLNDKSSTSGCSLPIYFAKVNYVLEFFLVMVFSKNVHIKKFKNMSDICQNSFRKLSDTKMGYTNFYSDPLPLILSGSAT